MNAHLASPHPKADPAATDIYFSADVETDGPIPGPYSMLSFALVYAGCFDGQQFHSPRGFNDVFYRELRPISERFEPEALRVNGLDRELLMAEGIQPAEAMDAAAGWVTERAHRGRPVLVAYPLSFDWSWLYWYFVNFATHGSPFNHSQCFDLKTAFAVKARLPIVAAGRSKIPATLRPPAPHTHNAVDDAKEQAQIFAKLFTWEGRPWDR